MGQFIVMLQILVTFYGKEPHGKIIGLGCSRSGIIKTNHSAQLQTRLEVLVDVESRDMQRRTNG